MNEAQAVAAIRNYFAGLWGSLTPLFHDDQPGTPPSTTWARLTTQHNFGDQTTMGDPGNNRHEQEGSVIVQIFQPQGALSIDARAKASAAAAMFRGKTAGAIRFSKTTVREIGADGHGFYQINVTARFQYDIFA